MILLDTHSWIWWVSNPENLSRAAKQTIDGAAKDGAIYISSISAWEVALLEARGRLRFTMDVRDWIVQSEELPFVNFWPVNNYIGIKAVQLPGAFHQDPADRIIVATAQILGAVVVSKDVRIRKYKHVQALW